MWDDVSVAEQANLVSRLEDGDAVISRRRLEWWSSAIRSIILEKLVTTKIELVDKLETPDGIRCAETIRAAILRLRSRGDVLFLSELQRQDPVHLKSLLNNSCDDVWHQKASEILSIGLQGTIDIVKNVSSWLWEALIDDGLGPDSDIEYAADANTSNANARPPSSMSPLLSDSPSLKRWCALWQTPSAAIVSVSKLEEIATCLVKVASKTPSRADSSFLVCASGAVASPEYPGDWSKKDNKGIDDASDVITNFSQLYRKAGASNELNDASLKLVAAYMVASQRALPLLTRASEDTTKAKHAPQQLSALNAFFAAATTAIIPFSQDPSIQFQAVVITKNIEENGFTVERAGLALRRALAKVIRKTKAYDSEIRKAERRVTLLATELKSKLKKNEESSLQRKQDIGIRTKALYWLRRKKLMEAAVTRARAHELNLVVSLNALRSSEDNVAQLRALQEANIALHDLQQETLALLPKDQQKDSEEISGAELVDRVLAPLRENKAWVESIDDALSKSVAVEDDEDVLGLQEELSKLMLESSVTSSAHISILDDGVEKLNLVEDEQLAHSSIHAIDEEEGINTFSSSIISVEKEGSSRASAAETTPSTATAAESATLLTATKMKKKKKMPAI